MEFLPLVGVAVLFYFLIVRPARRRNRELVDLQSSLSVGDDVMLTSGIYGTVTELAEDHVFVEIAEGITIRVVRGAIGSVQHETTSDSTEQADDAARRAEDN